MDRNSPQYLDLWFLFSLSLLCFTQVRVQVEDVNESPQFSSEVYKASIFSIAPYKTPVAHVKVKPNLPWEISLQFGEAHTPNVAAC